jgi:hypothetical protein
MNWSILNEDSTDSFGTSHAPPPPTGAGLAQGGRFNHFTMISPEQIISESVVKKIL